MADPVPSFVQTWRRVWTQLSSTEKRRASFCAHDDSCRQFNRLAFVSLWAGSWKDRHHRPRVFPKGGTATLQSYFLQYDSFLFQQMRVTMKSNEIFTERRDIRGSSIASTSSFILDYLLIFQPQEIPSFIFFIVFKRFPKNSYLEQFAQSEYNLNERTWNYFTLH